MNNQSQGNGGFSPGPLPGGRGPIRVDVQALARPRPDAQQQPAQRSLDFWVFLDIFAHRWVWLILVSLLCSGAFFFLGRRLIKEKFTASGQLQRIEIPGTSDFFGKTANSGETIAGLIRSPELLRRVGTNVQPPIPPEVLIKCIKVDPDPDSDFIKVLLAARAPGQAVDLLNAYLQEAVKFTREFQGEQAGRLVNDYLKEQVAQMGNDIDVLQKEFRGLGVSAELTNKVAAVGTNLQQFAQAQSPLLTAMYAERLQKALAELSELSSKYTPLHPLYRAKQDEVEDLKSKMGAASNNPAALVSRVTPLPFRPGDTSFNPQLDITRTHLLALEQVRAQLTTKQQEAQLYATNPPGMLRVFAPANLKTVQSNLRMVKVSIATIFGGFLGFGLSLALVLLVELADNRIKTAADVQRVTQLPVLTTLGDLTRMDSEARAQWAFRAWTMLQGRLSPSANHGLVCGVTSCLPGEGRSTWIKLLAEAASLTGFRVLTIATKPSPTHVPFTEEQPQQQQQDSSDEAMPMPDAPVAAETPEPAADYSQSSQQMAVAPNVLATPAKVTEQLTGENAQPVVHIPLPGWVWDLERRKQWRNALNQWRQIDNLVIFVELPPASVTEAVLLGCNLPNLLWLTEAGSPQAGETRAQLTTLRHARCNLIGAVLNRESTRSVKSRFPRWLGCMAAMALVGWSNAQAQDTEHTVPPTTKIQLRAEISPATPQPAAETAPPIQESTNQPIQPQHFSIVHPSQRAAWQQHLTLGPGDVVTIGLFDHPDLTRTEVAIAPDGHINFLQADVLASGLTIDELHDRLDKALADWYRAPHTMITPVAFHSKKYFILGKVMTKGAYILDRPITVLEAIARAHGIENGLVDRNLEDLADFQRSFLVRDGRRYPLNFEKLFQQGDLSQNIAIEPNDFLYFPSAAMKEVYVVGEVRLPGTVTFTPALTIIGAISARGGYTDRAYKARVLVVRGSLDNPERFAVDTGDILKARARDFPLRGGDIIFVNSRPFIKVEELADLAVTAFIQSFISSWVTRDVVKPFH